MTNARVPTNKEQELEEWMDLIEDIPIVPIPRKLKGQKRVDKRKNDGSFFSRQLVKEARKKAKAPIRSFKHLNEYFARHELGVTFEKKNGCYYLTDNSTKDPLFIRSNKGETILRVKVYNPPSSENHKEEVKNSDEEMYEEEQTSDTLDEISDETFKKDWPSILRKRKSKEISAVKEQTSSIKEETGLQKDDEVIGSQKNADMVKTHLDEINLSDYFLDLTDNNGCDDANSIDLVQSLSQYLQTDEIINNNTISPQNRASNGVDDQQDEKLSYAKKSSLYGSHGFFTKDEIKEEKDEAVPIFRTDRRQKNGS